MYTIAILELLKDYIILGFKILIPIAIIFFIAYGIIYKKIMKGTKIIKKRQLLLYALSIGYIVIIIGATFLSRFQDSIMYNGGLNFSLFSSYREAYHHIDANMMKDTLFRNLILNIMLFIPVGFLIPFYSDKLKKMYRVVLIGFLATVTIELTQHFNDYGVFEIDDVFNNTLGTLLGYCCFMIFYKLKNKENWKKIIGYITPFILTVGAFIGIFITYQVQEFGNFTFEHNYKINMNNVNVQSEIELSKERNNKSVYHIKTLSKEETRPIAENLFDKLNKKIDEDETMVEQTFITYWTPGRHGDENVDTVYHINIKYVGGSYSWHGGENIRFENGEIKFLSKIKDASREEIENALSKNGIQVPENAAFELNKKDQYLFSVDMQEQGDKLIDGQIKCEYYENKLLTSVYNEILTYDKVCEKEIISEDEAYQEILDGKFMYWEEVKSISIKNVELEYMLDSKGYYVPIYNFAASINGSGKGNIRIKAIK